MKSTSRPTTQRSASGTRMAAWCSPTSWKCPSKASGMNWFFLRSRDSLIIKSCQHYLRNCHGLRGRDWPLDEQGQAREETRICVQVWNDLDFEQKIVLISSNDILWTYNRSTYRAQLKGGTQVWWILLPLLLTTSAWPCLQHSRNLGTTFMPSPVYLTLSGTNPAARRVCGGFSGRTESRYCARRRGEIWDVHLSQVKLNWFNSRSYNKNCQWGRCFIERDINIAVNGPFLVRNLHPERAVYGNIDITL